ncbi:MAG: hypothetical protein J3R72DRAFT_433471 [Linnemannia gamsii]|nr:MAG: hypothetical protein J3R72DRAFT_433471 [Linnemannia gamsii]
MLCIPSVLLSLTYHIYHTQSWCAYTATHCSTRTAAIIRTGANRLHPLFSFISCSCSLTTNPQLLSRSRCSFVFVYYISTRDGHCVSFIHIQPVGPFLIFCALFDRSHSSLSSFPSR